MATFGKLTDGANSSSTSSNRKVVSSASPASNGLVDSLTMRCWVSAGSTVAKGIIYANNAGAPGALLAVTDEGTVNNTAEQANTFNFSGVNRINIVAGTTYWIGLHYQDPGVDNFLYSRDGTASGRQDNGDIYSDGPSDPFGAASALAGVIDCYVTYTESGRSDFLTTLGVS